MGELDDLAALLKVLQGEPLSRRQGVYLYRDLLAALFEELGMAPEAREFRELRLPGNPLGD